MVHTSNFVYIISKESNEKIKKFFVSNPKSLVFKSKSFQGINILLKKNHFSKLVYLEVNFIRLLEKFDIYEDDLEEVLDKLDLFSIKELGINFNDFNMLRIDYRFDYKMPNSKNREAYIELLQKRSFNKYRYKIKTIPGRTTVYFENNSSKLTIYDKEVEKKFKNLTLDTQEEGILRFEYVLYSNHLRYKKRVGDDRKLDVYFSLEKFIYYFDKEVLGILREGDYLKIYRARKIINKSWLKKKEKSGLINFLIDISRSSIDNVKNSSKYSSYYYHKYLELLRSLNINPLLIPKNCEAGSIINNPLRNYKTKYKKV